MADYVTLLGAEEVAQAARNMNSAAADMRRVAETISEAMRDSIRKIEAFREVLERHNALLQQG